MLNLNLEYDEAIIMSLTSTDFDTTNNYKGNGDIYLTNKNIIIVKTSFFGKAKEMRHYPLSAIKIFGNLPQVKISSTNNPVQVDVYLENVQLAISSWTNDLKGVKNFTNEIYKRLLTPEAYEKWCKENGMIEWNAEQIAQTIKGTIDTFKDTFIPPEATSEICNKCGGLINGYKDKVSSCPFCGNQQKL